MEIADAVAVVTGGASGIGRATALELARRGADVVVADLHEPRMEEVRAEVEGMGRRALAVRCDVSQNADVERLRDETLAAMGRVDIVMNNAGVAMLGPAEGLSMEEWDWILQINLGGAIRGVRAFLPHILERGSGHVVNTASVAGLFAYSWDHPAYITAKFGVVGLTESLALYLRPLGVGVSLLCPGLVNSNMGETARAGGTDDLGKWIQPMPLEEPVEPDFVGGLVADAIRDDRFLILTHPDVTLERMERRAADPDAFIQSQIDRLPQPPNLYRT
jgi:NAD(P)-dependent dehydrogenase (short-subunit alcohol dehydrogenase family)